LFAYSVKFLRDYLKERHRARTMIWGDMLLSQRVFNGTAHGAYQGAPVHLAIDDIPKDVIIVDWQYYPFSHPYPETGPPRRDFPSSRFFCAKGFDVIGATLQKPMRSVRQMKRFQRSVNHSAHFSKYVGGLNPERERGKGRPLGMAVTHWYLNPTFQPDLDRGKVASIVVAGEHFWNAGEHVEPAPFARW
jgi:hypothetical protein